uniref:NADH dehydrogenase subunit 6 n=1 Tax=Trouessartia rubecula TaxID=474308 RepID=A0A410HYG0_9ACAR|nr:NADH dehydrogenase subunit 6 [Trouessartia rubecula]QAB47271.1 NADH dehydrogenase subunit 6 [Trouessartia rubecula]
MLFMMLVIPFMNPSSNPLKLSLFLTYMSIIMGISSYLFTNSILTITITVISFSSGMMILFSYCSIMCNYEEKSSQKKISYFAIIPLTLISILTLSTFTNSHPVSMGKMTTETFYTNSLIFMMFMVIVSMVAINISFFNPTKKFMMSY